MVEGCHFENFEGRKCRLNIGHGEAHTTDGPKSFKRHTRSSFNHQARFYSIVSAKNGQAVPRRMKRYAPSAPAIAS